MHPLKNIVVRREAGAGEAVIRMMDTPLEPQRARVVIFRSGERKNSLLEGFTLTGGAGTK